MGYSDTRHPPVSMISEAKFAFSFGYIWSKPFGRTATVGTPILIAALWAIVSQPIAKPLIMLWDLEEKILQISGA